MSMSRQRLASASISALSHSGGRRARGEEVGRLRQVGVAIDDLDALQRGIDATCALLGILD